MLPENPASQQHTANTAGDDARRHKAAETSTSSNYSIHKSDLTETGGQRHRRPRRARRDNHYDAPLGGYNTSDDSNSNDSDTNSEGRHARRRRKKHQIKRRLHQKHKRDKIPLRLPFIKFLHSDAKNHLVAFMGEFVGTFMFLFFAFAGTQVANIGVGDSTSNSTTGAATGFNPATLLYIALCFGFSLMVNAWIFFRISGGLFNPTVTLALYFLEALSAWRAILLFIAQITGACFSSYIVSVLFPTAFNVRTTLATGTSIAQGVFIEAIGTAELIFTIIMLAAEKHRATAFAPVGIGLALFIGELVAVYYTGGSFNPARSFGPCAVSHNFDSEHWIYWVGPLIGCLLAVGFYKLNKILEYELANPGQDGDVQNDPTQNPNHDLAEVVEQRALEVEVINEVEQHEGGFDNLSLATGDLGRDQDVMDADPVIGIEHGEGDLEKIETRSSKKSTRPSRVRSNTDDMEAGLSHGNYIDSHVSREKDHNLMPSGAK